MKKLILCIVVTIFAISYSEAQEKLNINTSKSTIKWSGDYSFYFNGHYGYIDFREGYFIKTNKMITGGEFIIDMNTITCKDIEKEDSNKDLVNHLKDPDFFDVKKFPLAKLIITKVTYHDSTHMEIEAKLTIKGITNPVTFQAEVDFQKQQMSTKFKIDRRKWEINYTSPFKDGAISDAIGFEVKLSL